MFNVLLQLNARLAWQRALAEDDQPFARNTKLVVDIDAFADYVLKDSARSFADGLAPGTTNWPEKRPGCE
jgi:hypothetical protein